MKFENMVKVGHNLEKRMTEVVYSDAYNALSYVDKLDVMTNILSDTQAEIARQMMFVIETHEEEERQNNEIR